MNIYINMFFNIRFQTQGTSLQRQSLYNGSNSGGVAGDGVPARGGAP